MGSKYSHMYETYTSPDTVPNFVKPPIHDSLEGFTNGRKKRELIVSVFIFQ